MTPQGPVAGSAPGDRHGRNRPGERQTATAVLNSVVGIACARDAGPFDRLRRSLCGAIASADVASDGRATFAPLIDMALRYIDALEDQGFDTLPGRVALFGRAHATRRKRAYLHPDSRGSLKFLDLDTGKREKPASPDMSCGAPVDADDDITTEKSGALLLYDDGTCRRVEPYRTVGVGPLARNWGATRALTAGDD